MEEYDEKKAAEWILEKFRAQGDFLILDAPALESMVNAALALDEAYIKSADADGEGVYDDDEAFDFLFKGLGEAFPEQKMYLMRFCEDYMDYNEAYLEAAGLIDWE